MRNMRKILATALAIVISIGSMLPNAVAIEKPIDIFDTVSVAVNSNVQQEKDIDVIQNANDLANGVQSYYKDFTARSFYVENQNMSFEYALSSIQDTSVLSLKNTQGKTYIENTFDAFVRLTDGSVYYSAGSTLNAAVNIFRYGYYYEEIRFEGKNFINGIDILDAKDISLDATLSNQCKFTSTDDGLNVQITNGYDPYIVFPEIDYSTVLYKYLVIEMKTNSEYASSSFYITSGSNSLQHNQHVDFALVPDGEYHTYEIYLGNIDDYTGSITKVRLDFNRTYTDDTFDIKSIKLVSANDCGVSTLSSADIFHTYSDKLHHEFQIVAQETTSSIAEIGMMTSIAANTVDKLVVKDKNTIVISFKRDLYVIP